MMEIRVVKVMRSVNERSLYLNVFQISYLNLLDILLNFISHHLVLRDRLNLLDLFKEGLAALAECRNLESTNSWLTIFNGICWLRKCLLYFFLSWLILLGLFLGLTETLWAHKVCIMCAKECFAVVAENWTVVVIRLHFGCSIWLLINLRNLGLFGLFVWLVEELN